MSREDTDGTYTPNDEPKKLGSPLASTMAAANSTDKNGQDTSRATHPSASARNGNHDVAGDDHRTGDDKRSLSDRDCDLSTTRSDLAALFGKLYPNLPAEDGMKASRDERLSKGYKSITLTYGEVSAEGFWDILMRIRDAYDGLPEKDGVFYDLGCGTGKPVFAAAAAHPWERCVGIEILSDLHGISEKALQRWEGGVKDGVHAKGSHGAMPEMEFVCGDFTVLDWSDGDIVYANSTCFDDDLMGHLAKGAAALKEGAIVITNTDPVPSAAFEVLAETSMIQAGRSATTCFIQRRLPMEAPSYGPA